MLRSYTFRKEHIEGRTAVSFNLAASNPDAASVIFNQLFRNPQSQAGANFLFGGEEGLEYLVALFSRNAVAGVSNHDLYSAAIAIVPIGRSANVQYDFFPTLACVHRVGDQIQNDLANMPG